MIKILQRVHYSDKQRPEPAIVLRSIRRMKREWIPSDAPNKTDPECQFTENSSRVVLLQILLQISESQIA